MKQTTDNNSTTQDFLEIYDVVSDILILKDGSASLILQADAVNFDLLAEAEQDAIIYSYAGLLNSLNYPIQILISSKTKDVSNYLRSLEEREEESLSDLKKSQIREYRQFVGELIRERNVLDKKFYIIIPASALELGLVSAQSVIPGVKPKAVAQFDKGMIIEKAFNILYPKRDHLIAQFARIGLIARQLDTQEIIRLFYNNYNPEAAEGQEIADTNSYTTPLVQTFKKGDSMVNANIPSDQATPAVGQTPTAVSPTPINNPTPAMPTMPSSPAPAAPAPAQMPQPTPMPSAPVAPAAPSPVGSMAGQDPQAEINNTIKELGTDTVAATPSATNAPASTTTTPAMTTAPTTDTNK